MSAALTNHMLTQIAFKRLSGKAMTSGLLSLPGETLGSTVQSSATTIFGQVVPNAPVSSSAHLFQIQSASVGQPGTVQQVEFDLVRVVGTKYDNLNGVEIEALEQDDGGTQAADTIAPRQGFGASLGNREGSFNTFHAYTIKLPAAYVASCSAAEFTTNASTAKVPGSDAPFENGFMSTGSVQMQVVPEYLSTVIGTSNAYIPEVIATNGSVMNSTDDIDYYFDAMAGVLFVQDPSGSNNAIPENPPINASQPGKVRAFLYVGQYQSEVISGDTVSLHFSASAGTGFSFANNATASFESSSAGITVAAVGTNTITVGEASDSVTFKDLTITETASISYLKVTYETASQLLTSGSTIFGNTMDDFHDFTGSVYFSSSEFGWDTPSGNSSQAPLVYDASTGLIHTGSLYALSSSAMTQFQISGSNFIGGSTTQNGNFAITEGNTITFAVSGGLEVTASAGDILTINATGLSASIATDIANATASISTLTTASSSFATDIINATASILTITNEIDNIQVATSGGIHINTGSGVPGGTTFSLLDTASFVGGTGITTAISSDVVTISVDTSELTSPLYISASGTGDATGSTSLAYGASASFAANGGGLEVTESSGQITYTIVPDDVLNGATDTATFNFTSSHAVSASYVSGAIDGGASTVQVTEENNDTTRLGVVFSNLAAADLDTNGEINEDVILKGDHGVAFSPGRNTFFVGDASTTTYLAENPTGIGVGANDTFNFLTDGVTMFADSTTVAPLEINVGGAAGTVFFKGSASIDGDLTVNGTTTSIRTTNLEVEDQFILLVSRSTAENLDGGIIIQTGKDSATAVGTALFYDDSESRWGLTKADDTAFNATSATPRQYVVSVSSSNEAPTNNPSDFGGSAASRYGMMYIDTSDSAGDGNTIWIYGE